MTVLSVPENGQPTLCFLKTNKDNSPVFPGCFHVKICTNCLIVVYLKKKKFLIGIVQAEYI